MKSAIDTSQLAKCDHVNMIFIYILNVSQTKVTVHSAITSDMNAMKARFAVLHNYTLHCLHST